MKRRKLLIVAQQSLLSAMLMAGCSTSGAGEIKSAPTTAPSLGAASSVTLPQVKTLRLADEPDNQLPSGNGRDTTQVYCGMCHTTRYIVVQPPLSRAVWTTEVAKMRTAFSGPIPQEKVAEIVDYLVAVNGALTTLPAKAAESGK